MQKGEQQDGDARSEGERQACAAAGGGLHLKRGDAPRIL
jgi:hypothetical protein